MLYLLHLHVGMHRAYPLIQTLENGLFLFSYVFISQKAFLGVFLNVSPIEISKEI